MAVHYKTKGIILKRVDWGEANRVFTVFTQDFGKLELWAVSVRKGASKLRAGLEPLSLSQLEFVEGRNRKVLVEAICLKDASVFRKDLRRLKAGLVVASLVDRVVTGEQKDQALWELLELAFGQLRQGAEPKAAVESFTPRFLAATGYANFESYLNQ